MTESPRYDDLPALFAAALPPAQATPAPDGGRVYTVELPSSDLPNHIMFLDDTVANAMRFAEATERVAAALGRAAAALGRMRDGHPIGQAIIDGFIAGLHDARPRRVRPPRRAARRAHARRVAKRH